MDNNTLPGCGPRRICLTSSLNRPVVVSVMIVRLMLALHNRPHIPRLRICHHPPSHPSKHSSISSSNNSNLMLLVRRPPKIRIIYRISWPTDRMPTLHLRRLLQQSTSELNVPRHYPHHSPIGHPTGLTPHVLSIPSLSTENCVPPSRPLSCARRTIIANHPPRSYLRQALQRLIRRLVPLLRRLGLPCSGLRQDTQSTLIQNLSPHPSLLLTRRVLFSARRLFLLCLQSPHPERVQSRDRLRCRYHRVNVLVSRA